MIIGFTGLAGSGKTTAADHIDGERMSFASPLKEMLIALGLSADEVYGSRKTQPCNKLGGKTPRQALQTLGTEWGRNMICENLWTSLMLDRILEHQRLYPKVDIVIDDVRFLSEAKMIHELGGVVVRIIRPRVEEQSHQSEQEQREIPTDNFVTNHDNIVDFKIRVEQTVNKLKKQNARNN